MSFTRVGYGKIYVSSLLTQDKEARVFVPKEPFQSRLFFEIIVSTILVKQKDDCCFLLNEPILYCQNSSL